MITLIIVDCQNDFLSGTMCFKNSRSILEPIKDYIQDHQEEIEKIIFTADWHPHNHSSFKKNGGKSPSHCVQFTPGACIESKLLKLVQSLELDYSVSTKGELEEVEEDGAFSEIEKVKDSVFGDRYYFNSMVSTRVNTEFVICGISGDGCVKSTIENLLTAEIVPKVYLKGIISKDGGKSLNQFIKTKELEIIE